MDEVRDILFGSIYDTYEPLIREEYHELLYDTTWNAVDAILYKLTKEDYTIEKFFKDE